MSSTMSGGYDPAMYGSIPPAPITEEGAAQAAHDAGVEGGALVEPGMPGTEADLEADLEEAAATIAAIDDPANDEVFEALRRHED